MKLDETENDLLEQLFPLLANEDRAEMKERAYQIQIRYTDLPLREAVLLQERDRAALAFAALLRLVG